MYVLLILGTRHLLIYIFAVLPILKEMGQEDWYFVFNYFNTALFWNKNTEFFYPKNYVFTRHSDTHSINC